MYFVFEFFPAKGLGISNLQSISHNILVNNTKTQSATFSYNNRYESKGSPPPQKKISNSGLKRTLNPEDVSSCDTNDDTFPLHCTFYAFL